MSQCLIARLWLNWLWLILGRMKFGVQWLEKQFDVVVIARVAVIVDAVTGQIYLTQPQMALDIFRCIDDVSVFR